MPAADFLALRFTIATVALVLIVPRAVSRLRAPVRRQSVIAGGVHGVAQVMQTVGLGHTDASVSGFITGLHVVATPLIAAGVFRSRFDRPVRVAVGLSTVGLAVLLLRGASVGFGETITFGCALLYAVHIVLLPRWSRPSDAVGMATVQVAVIAAVSAVCAVHGGLTLPDRPADW